MKNKGTVLSDLSSFEKLIDLYDLQNNEKFVEIA